MLLGPAQVPGLPVDLLGRELLARRQRAPWIGDVERSIHGEEALERLGLPVGSSLDRSGQVDERPSTGPKLGKVIARSAEPALMGGQT